MPEHRARAADNCSCSHNQWPPVGERSHLPVWLHHALAFCTRYAYIEVARATTTISQRRLPSNASREVFICCLSMVWKILHCRGIKSEARLVPPQMLYSDRNMTFEGMWSEVNEQLFNRLINDPNHVLHKLLPPPTTASQRFNFRSRRHTFQLPEHHTSLLDSNFLVMLYKDGY